MPDSGWKLFNTIAAVVIPLGVLGLAVLKFRWQRRSDQFRWEIDENYVIDTRNDRARFPGVFAQQNPVDGDTGIMVRVKFQGRGSITIVGLTFEWNDIPNSGVVPTTPITLTDGNTWEQLIFL